MQPIGPITSRILWCPNQECHDILWCHATSWHHFLASPAASWVRKEVEIFGTHNGDGEFFECPGGRCFSYFLIWIVKGEHMHSRRWLGWNHTTGCWVGVCASIASWLENWMECKHWHHLNWMFLTQGRSARGGICGNKTYQQANEEW